MKDLSMAAVIAGSHNFIDVDLRVTVQISSKLIVAIRPPS